MKVEKTDTGGYECDSCGLTLTQKQLELLKAENLDVQLNKPKRAIKFLDLTNDCFQLFGTQEEINLFIELLMKKRMSVERFV